MIPVLDMQRPTSETHNYEFQDPAISSNTDRHRQLYLEAYYPEAFFKGLEDNFYATGSSALLTSLTRLPVENDINISGIFKIKDLYGSSSSTTQSRSIKPIFLSYTSSKNFTTLKTSFDKERQKASISQDDVNSLFWKLALVISELPFIKSAVEITSSDSIKMSMTFANDILLIISKPFDTLEDVSEDDIIFSVFKNRERIASNVAKTTTFVEGFKRFLSL